MHSTSGPSLVISGNNAQRIGAEHVLEGYIKAGDKFALGLKRRVNYHE